VGWGQRRNFDALKNRFFTYAETRGFTIDTRHQPVSNRLPPPYRNVRAYLELQWDKYGGGALSRDRALLRERCGGPALVDLAVSDGVTGPPSGDSEGSKRYYTRELRPG
jgi:hypothetical protein